MTSEVVKLREANTIMVVTLEKLALHPDKSVSLVATAALQKVKILQQAYTN